MGKMAEEYRLNPIDADYFQWLTDNQWQQHQELIEDYLKDKYGRGATFQLKLLELKIRQDNG